MTYDWNDLRHFLAVARSGSAVEAAKSMGVNPSTISRRIEALEAAFGTRLLEKTAAGSGLTELGRELIPVAERAELENEAVLLFVEQRVRRIAGRIKVTTNETIAELLLMPALSQFAKLYPDLHVDVDVSSSTRDLAKGEADVALRASRDRGTANLVTRKLSDLPWAIYCSRDYAATYGCPAAADDLSKHQIIGANGALATIGAFQWLEEKARSAAIVRRTNTLPNVLTSVRSGLGISALPCVRGEADSELLRCIGPNDELDSSLWLVVRSQTKDDPKIRAFSTFMVSITLTVRRLLHMADDTKLCTTVA